MTALYRGICYPEADAAKQAACSAASTIWGDKDAVYSVECASQTFGGSDMTLCKRVNGGACQMLNQPYPTFPECSHSGGYDMAAQWFYLVLPLFIFVFYIRRLMNLFGENE